MRHRLIRAEFFKNEILGKADPLASLLFEGLWCLADKEGRLKDIPERIKIEVFPYRPEIDINSYLIWLADNNFIIRYQVDGNSYIQVTNFTKHQYRYQNEKESILPSFKDGKPSDPYDGIPNYAIALPCASQAVSEPINNCPQKQIVEIYHQECPTLPRVKSLTASSVTLRSRWREDPDRQNLDWWRGYFQWVNSSEFLIGNKTEWRATFLWLIKKSNMEKILNGAYGCGTDPRIQKMSLKQQKEMNEIKAFLERDK